MLSACQSKNIIAPNNNAESLNYLFISHIRTYTNPSC